MKSKKTQYSQDRVEISYYQLYNDTSCSTNGLQLTLILYSIVRPSKIRKPTYVEVYLVLQINYLDIRMT